MGREDFGVVVMEGRGGWGREEEVGFVDVLGLAGGGHGIWG